MRYEGKIYRPPSEADAFILQATVGCSWNHCTYCDMYRDKAFRVRKLPEVLADIGEVARAAPLVDKVFVADGDALAMEFAHWEPILKACRAGLPKLRRVSAYATARNVLEKSPAELRELGELGLRLLYLGPETGDDETFRRIAKGATFEEHVEAGRKLHAAGIEQSVIFLLGAGGVERSQAHAEGSARLITAMNPAFASLLTLTVIEGTPLGKLAESGRFRLPSVEGMLRELRTIVDLARPTDAVFRTNHASNYVALGGRLPADRQRILEVVDRALKGELRLRPEWARGL